MAALGSPQRSVERSRAGGHFDVEINAVEQRAGNP
jgi:hypothetical protein